MNKQNADDRSLKEGENGVIYVPKKTSESIVRPAQKNAFTEEKVVISTTATPDDSADSESSDDRVSIASSCCMSVSGEVYSINKLDEPVTRRHFVPNFADRKEINPFVNDRPPPTEWLTLTGLPASTLDETSPIGSSRGPGILDETSSRRPMESLPLRTRFSALKECIKPEQTEIPPPSNELEEFPEGQRDLSSRSLSPTLPPRFRCSFIMNQGPKPSAALNAQFSPPRGRSRNGNEGRGASLHEGLRTLTPPATLRPAGIQIFTLKPFNSKSPLRRRKRYPL